MHTTTYAHSATCNHRTPLRVILTSASCTAGVTGLGCTNPSPQPTLIISGLLSVPLGHVACPPSSTAQNRPSLTASRCITLQYTATYCKILQDTAILRHSNSLQRRVAVRLGVFRVCIAHLESRTVGGTFTASDACTGAQTSDWQPSPPCLMI